MGYNKADFLAGIAAGRAMKSWPVMNGDGSDIFIELVEVGTVDHPSLDYTTATVGSSDGFYSPLTIHWGDGITEQFYYSAHTRTHTYPAAGAYLVIYEDLGRYTRNGIPTEDTALTAILTPLPSTLRSWDAAWAIFNNCAMLKRIPSNLFQKCGQYVEVLDDAFYGCRSLINIPNGLLDYCPNAEEFVSMCCGCVSLTSIPSGLFDRIANGTKFVAAFFGCAGITSDVPALWEMFPDSEGSACFSGCVNAANYADIPTVWGGPA